jgi:hypothetical protein
MIETILGKDGITPEMLKGQQERVMVVEKLVQATSPEVRAELIKQNEKLIDEQFFALFSRLIQGAMSSGQEPIARQMNELQKQLLTETEFGRQLQASMAEMEIAAKTLQDAGQGLTREKLLEFVIVSPNEARTRGYASLARGGMDYTFFQLLTDKIDKAQGDEKAKLERLREKLLELTNEMDKQMQARLKQAQGFIDQLLTQEDIAKATRDNLDVFTQDAAEVVQTMLRQASESNDYERMGKLQKIIEVLREASAPPEMAFVEQLLDLPDEAAIEKVLTENNTLMNDAFMEALNGLVAQVDAAANQGNEEAKVLGGKLGMVFKVALKVSMKKNMG